jgi:centromere protein C
MPREPAARRKSSLGTRRGPPRQHIPFRADDLARGKKTGMAVAYVDRNSDEFEPFEQVIKQADNRTPPRIKSKKKRISIALPVEEVDEDGEMSMDLAESEQQQTSVSVPSSSLVSCRQPRKSPGLLHQRTPRVCSQ